MAIAFGELSELETILWEKEIEIDKIKILGAMEDAVENAVEDAVDVVDVAVDGLVTEVLCIFDTLCKYITLYDENSTPEENLQAVENLAMSL